MSIEILKRAPDELELAAKRTKQDLALATTTENTLPPRTSDLTAPIMHLTGHAAEVRGPTSPFISSDFIFIIVLQ